MNSSVLHVCSGTLLKGEFQVSNYSVYMFLMMCRQWSSEGVEMIGQNETHYTCHSTHLTSFAVLVSVQPLQVYFLLSTLFHID